jgi:hypothetical protein
MIFPSSHVCIVYEVTQQCLVLVLECVVELNILNPQPTNAFLLTVKPHPLSNLLSPLPSPRKKHHIANPKPGLIQQPLLRLRRYP